MYRINFNDNIYFEIEREESGGIIRKFINNNRLKYYITKQQVNLLYFVFEKAQKGEKIDAIDFIEEYKYKIEKKTPDDAFSDIKSKIKKNIIDTDEKNDYIYGEDIKQKICIVDIIKKDKINGYYYILNGYTITKIENIKEIKEISIQQIENYIDRFSYQNEIDKKLKNEHIVTLFGEEGVGKKTLAKWYALKKGGEYGNIKILSAKSIENFVDSIGMNVDLRYIKEYDLARLIKEGRNSVGNNKRILIIINDYGECVNNQYSFEIIERTIKELAGDKNNDIIITTNKSEEYCKSKIEVRGFLRRDVEEFFKKCNIEFTKEYIDEVFACYGIPNKDEKRIPVNVCVALKDNAILNGGIAKIDFFDKDINTRAYDTYISEVFKKVSGDEINNGWLFKKILKILSFVNAEKIEKRFLLEIIKICLPVASDEVESCLNYYDSQMHILNYIDNEKQLLSMNETYKKIIWKYTQSEREELQKKIINYFLTVIYPFSYYGTNTMKQNDIMQHMYSFYKMTKGLNNYNYESYYKLVRAMMWYYGYVREDRDRYDEIYNELFNDESYVPLVEKYFIKADGLIIKTKFSGINEDLDKIEKDIKELIIKAEKEYEFQKNHECKTLYIRCLLAKALYDQKESKAEESKATILEGIKKCDELLCGELTEEESVFVIESKVKFLQIESGLKRKRENNFDKSYELNLEAINCFKEYKYESSVHKLIYNKRYKRMEWADTYLKAFSYNLMAVAYTEKRESLGKLFEAEDMNKSALKEYEKLNSKYDILNQLENFINIYAFQSKLIIEKINNLIREKYAPKNNEEWKKCYNMADVVPDLLDKNNRTKSIKEWMVDYHFAIDKAMESFNDCKNRCMDYYKKGSWSYYSYIIPLLSSVRMENSFSNDEKYEILRNKLKKSPFLEDFKKFKKWIKNTAMLKHENYALACRYYGVCKRYFIQLSRGKCKESYLDAVEALKESYECSYNLGKRKDMDTVNEELKTLNKLFSESEPFLVADLVKK